MTQAMNRQASRVAFLENYEIERNFLKNLIINFGKGQNTKNVKG